MDSPKQSENYITEDGALSANLLYRIVYPDVRIMDC